MIETRKVRVTQCPCGEGWRWECSKCEPHAHGARHGADAFARVYAISLPHHFSRRGCHHRWVARHK